MSALVFMSAGIALAVWTVFAVVLVQATAQIIRTERSRR
jgi:hypothetical protein